MTPRHPSLRPPRRRREAGFSMLEVLVAILLAMIGLVGTLAVQQTVLSATATSNDAQIALRLATRAMEEFAARRTSAGPPIVDMLAPIAGTAWSAPVYLDAAGQAQPSPSGRNRWRLQTLVTDTGFTRPYNLSVVVTYAIDTGAPKAVRLDAERRKTW